MIDGQPRGVTPLTLTLPPGRHTVVLDRGGMTRLLGVTLKEGTEVAHYVDLGQPVSAAPKSMGELHVASQPSGARVVVDGLTRGVTPLVVTDVAVGQHAVQVQGDTGTVRRLVTVRSEESTSLVVSMVAPSTPTFGWVSITSPVVLQVLEGDQRLGTTETGRLMMSAGRHSIDVANPLLGFRQSHTVHVPAGAGATLKVNLPDGVVNLNALPWGEVWVDGRRIGETPLGNVRLAIGPHSASFRHPEFGERTQDFVVTLIQPTRVAVDFRK